VIVDLIIPAYNEEGNIDALFDALSALPEGTLRHVVVGDNGSTDRTARRAVARGARAVSEPRRGYGGACLKAIEWLATQETPPDVVVFLDADLSDDPGHLPRLLAPIEAGRADLVIGSRRRLATPGSLNTVQRFGNNLACALMRRLTGRRYSDLGPFRAIRWATLRKLDMQDRTWGWTVEMQMKAAMRHVPFEEIDVPYRPRWSGRSKISGTVRGVVAAGWKIVATVFAVWWRER